MLRHLVRSFHRTLTLQPTAAAAVWTTQSLLGRRTFFNVAHSAVKTAADAGADAEAAQLGWEAANEADSDYIVPYTAERERLTSANDIVETLRSRFRLTAVDIKHIMNDEVVHRKYRERSLLATMETLALAGVNKRSFVAHPWLITLDNSRLEKKLQLIRSMPVRDINHFAAFLRLSVPRLNKLVSHLNSERESVPTGNRLYYISEQLHTNPDTIAKYLAKRLFILEMPFDMLEQNLKLMIDYEVPSMSILKDLWAFRYTPKSVRLRFERAKRAKKDKIMPWMVRCPEPILQRSLKLTLDEQEVLGNKSVAEYVAERLQFTVDETKAIMAKHPQVNTVRVTKIKEVLDYLIDEVGFTRYEIAQNPRILCHSLKTTKQRLEELKSHGCRPSSLVIVCRSKREYQKFVTSWLAIREKMDVEATESGDKGSPNT